MSDLHTFRKIKSENREKGAFFAFLQAEMPKNLEVHENRCTFALLSVRAFLRVFFAF